MSIQEAKIKGKEGENLVALEVAKKGAQITVRPGKFCLEGKGGEIGSNQVYKMTKRDVDTDVLGMIVMHRSTGAFDFMVDEVEMDGVDSPVDFGVTSYRKMFNLFSISIPAGTSSLDDLEMTVWSVVEAEDQPPEEEAAVKPRPVTEEELAEEAARRKSRPDVKVAPEEEEASDG